MSSGTPAATRAPELYEWLLTTWPAVVADLDRPAGYQITVEEGWPFDDPTTDIVVLGGYETNQAEKNLGGRHRTEDITLTGWIRCARPGENTTTIRRTVHDIADPLSARMRINPSGLTLGGAVCHATFAPKRFASYVADRTRVGVLEWTLTAHEARLG